MLLNLPPPAQAKVQLDQAHMNLERMCVLAPVGGYMTNLSAYVSTT
jgi:multidrug resistance efflux pump